MLCVADCVADCVRFDIPEPTKRQHIGNEIDAAFIFAGADFVKVRVLDILGRVVIYVVSSRFRRAIYLVYWRRGELNPCPRRYRRKHLHVYPVISFREPNLAPAHCRLPSVHEFPSPSGAVAPPFD
jgi:hypothetical protein